MTSSLIPTSGSGDREGRKPVTIFIASWGRPVYLWMCLDALWRFSRSSSRVVLLDNAHPTHAVGHVIAAFEARGLFAEVVRFPTNSFQNITSAYHERLQDVGPFHVFMESDAMICEKPGCWLGEMLRIMEANPTIGMLGSLIDPRDFVASDVALVRAGGDQAAAEFLAKLQSPERAFIDVPLWADTARDFFPTEPPCPIGNPPGRLLMLRTDVMREIGLQPDAALADAFRRRGMQPAVTPLVRHRHLSLLNIFDYNDYSRVARDAFFSPPNAAASAANILSATSLPDPRLDCGYLR
jgi:hypothetical protein